MKFVTDGTVHNRGFLLNYTTGTPLLPLRPSVGLNKFSPTVDPFEPFTHDSTQKNRAHALTSR
jgi:hypothetical protein